VRVVVLGVLRRAVLSFGPKKHGSSVAARALQASGRHRTTLVRDGSPGVRRRRRARAAAAACRTGARRRPTATTWRPTSTARGARGSRTTTPSSARSCPRCWCAWCIGVAAATGSRCRAARAPCAWRACPWASRPPPCAACAANRSVRRQGLGIRVRVGVWVWVGVRVRVRALAWVRVRVREACLGSAELTQLHRQSGSRSC
jgi:hypothetical protein